MQLVDNAREALDQEQEFEAERARVLLRVLADLAQHQQQRRDDLLAGQAFGMSQLTVQQQDEATQLALTHSDQREEVRSERASHTSNRIEELFAGSVQLWTRMSDGFGRIRWWS